MASFDDDPSTADVSVGTLKDRVSKLNLFELDHHTFHDEPAGSLSILDLPVYELPASMRMVKCIVETMLDIPGLQ